jgi:DMSO/TMAO reductase YedYZ molybdopterin-dependent catalytic subunit
MPGNGYPMRLLLPGYQGNMNVKYLRRIKVIDQRPTATSKPKTIRRFCRAEKPGAFTSSWK